MYDGWRQDEIEAHVEAMRMTDGMLAMQGDGRSLKAIGEAYGMSGPSAWRWLSRRRDFDAGADPRALLAGKSTGRPPICQPTAEDIRILKAKYVKTNRNKKAGSKSLAARLCARDPDCRLSPDVREAILKKRTSKHSLPKALRDAMAVSPAVVAEHRAPRNARLGGMYCPGSVRMIRDEDGDGSRRARAGERQSWDDGSINFCVTVPWPWGGDPCSDRFGVKVGRFQLLCGIDDGTDFCPGFSFVIRALDSYRSADACGACYRVWRDTYLPDSVMFEGGVWQSNRMLDFLRMAGVRMNSAKGRPHQKLIENYWNRLWSVMSVDCAQIGRYRGEMERENKEWMRCQKGAVDPRTIFPDLATGIETIRDGLRFLNHDQVESPIYGRWVPADLHAEQLGERSLARVDAGLSWMLAPEIHDRVARRGMVKVTAETPFGVKFPYFFADAALEEFDGARVRVYFDPWDEMISATIVTLDERCGKRPGDVIAQRAQCVNGVPQIFDVFGVGSRDDRAYVDTLVGIDESALARAIEQRKAMHRIVRTEYRALGFDGRTVKASETEVRGPDGSHLRMAGGAAIVGGSTTAGGDGATVSLTGGNELAADVPSVARVPRESVADVLRPAWELVIG